MLEGQASVGALLPPDWAFLEGNPIPERRCRMPFTVMIRNGPGMHGEGWVHSPPQQCQDRLWLSQKEPDGIVLCSQWFWFDKVVFCLCSAVTTHSPRLAAGDWGEGEHLTPIFAVGFSEDFLPTPYPVLVCTSSTRQSTPQDITQELFSLMPRSTAIYFKALQWASGN